MGNQLTDIMAPGAPPSFLPGFRPLHIVIVGLDGAGKTALLYRLKLREFVETIPTKGFNTEKIKVVLGGGGGGTSPHTVTFRAWDVGGQEKLRPLWRSFTRGADGLVFVVDASEPERLDEARVELHRISRAAQNQGVPVLIAATKQDRPASPASGAGAGAGAGAALTAADLETRLAVHELSGATLHHLQSCSAVDGHGLQAGLEALHDMILRRRKMLKHSKVRRR